MIPLCFSTPPPCSFLPVFMPALLASSSWTLFLMYPPVTSCVAVELMWNIKITLKEFSPMHCHLSAIYYHSILLLQKYIYILPHIYISRFPLNFSLFIHIKSIRDKDEITPTSRSSSLTRIHCSKWQCLLVIFGLSYSQIYHLCSDLAVSPSAQLPFSPHPWAQYAPPDPHVMHSFSLHCAERTVVNTSFTGHSDPHLDVDLTSFNPVIGCPSSLASLCSFFHGSLDCFSHLSCLALYCFDTRYQTL